MTWQSNLRRDPKPSCSAGNRRREFTVIKSQKTKRGQKDSDQFRKVDFFLVFFRYLVASQTVFWVASKIQEFA